MQGLVLVFTLISANSGTTMALAKDLPKRELCSPKVLHEAEAKYAHPPVSAREDRVWHAIPGLNGWTLEEKKTQIATKAAADGKVHFVWRKTMPEVSLKSLLPSPIYRGPSDEKSIALMVNVSWGGEYLPTMLKTLAEENVHATFFLDGAWVQKNPGLTREIVQLGHAVGSHGTGHPDFRRLTTGQVEQQMQKTGMIIKKVTGRAPIAFAPPSGSYDNRAVAVAHRYHLPTILWTVDTIDWRKPSSQTIVSRVLRGSTPGSLVLMHPTEHTAQALPILIQGLRKKGYHFKTIDDVIGERRLSPPAVG